MSLTFANESTASFILTVKPVPLNPQLYADINRSLKQRLASLDSKCSLYESYSYAIATTEIVSTLHRNFTTKIENLAAYYKMIGKIPFQHSLLKSEPYNSIVFHADEYKGNSPIFSDKVNSVAAQLSLFISQFLETYHQIETPEMLDAIVDWTDTLCFDAQIEGRFFNSLILKFLDAHIKNDSSNQLKLLERISAIAKKMSMTNDACIGKIKALAINTVKNVNTMHLIEHQLNSYFSASPNSKNWKK